MPQTHSHARRLLLYAAALAALAGVGWQVERLVRLAPSNVPIDFLAFWTAAHLNNSGRNPYDPVVVLEAERSLGYDPPMAVVIWNPPWTFAAIAAFAWLPVGLAQVAWFALQAGMIVFAADRLWIGARGPEARRWVSWLLGLTFAPTTFLVSSGQITGPCLPALVLFLAAWRVGRPVSAGIFGSVTAIKPHLLGLYAAALVADGLSTRRGLRVLAGGGMGMAAMILLAVVPNGDLFSQYAGMLKAPATADHRPVTDWASPTLGYALRSFVPGNPFWIQLVPSILGVLGILLARIRTGPIDWGKWLPWTVVGSLALAPYGARMYDFVLLLVAVVPLAAGILRHGNRSRIAAFAVGFAVVNLGAFAGLAMKIGCDSMFYAWYLPAVVLGLLATRRWVHP
jgi:hypothetical protein